MTKGDKTVLLVTVWLGGFFTGALVFGGGCDLKEFQRTTEAGIRQRTTIIEQARQASRELDSLRALLR